MPFLQQRKNPLLIILLFAATSMLMAQPDYYKNIFTHARDSLVKELKKHPAPDTARAMA